MTSDREIEERVFQILYTGLYEYLIDRNYAEVPDTFVPAATFIAVANDNLLSLTHPLGSKVRLRRRRRWSEHNHERQEDFSGVVGANDRVLLARQYGDDWDRWGQTWAVERKEGVHEVLAFDCGPTPIFCFNPQAAMVLAERCHPSPPPKANFLRWIPMAA